MVQLAFGSHPTRGLIHISQAERGSLCACTCPDCGRTLVAKKGKNAHHFAHNGDREGGIDLDCGGGGQMTALHQFARDIFLRRGAVTLPEAAIDGSIAIRSEEIAVVDARTELLMEGLQPDVHFSRSGRPCLIEIAVTHEIGAVKAAIIRRQKLETFEIKLDRLLDQKPLDSVAEDYVRHLAPRQWIFNAAFESEKQRMLACSGIPERGQQVLGPSAAEYARLYDEAEMRAKRPVGPAIKSRKAAIASYLNDPNKTFGGYFTISPEDWRAFILLDCLGRHPVSLQQIMDRLRQNQYLDRALAGLVVDADDARAAGLPTRKAESCVFSYLTWLEGMDAAVALRGGWCRLIDVPEYRPGAALHTGPRTDRHAAVDKRCAGVQSILDRIARHLHGEERRKFEEGIEAWWHTRLLGRDTPIDIIKGGNITRLLQRLEKLEKALASEKPAIDDAVKLPLESTLDRLWREEKARGPERVETLKEKAIAQLGDVIGPIWLEMVVDGSGNRTAQQLASESDSSLDYALKALASRSTLHADRSRKYLEDWAKREYGDGGVGFIKLHHPKLPLRTTPLNHCFDMASFEEMKAFVIEFYGKKIRR
ncbi:MULTISPECIES: hypothetical protein [Rhizobium]|uniref:C2H2-type domain-containing protein n=1 Tax=Rhizobium paranaense TaxID=1650438 RepID=A0A7W8XYD7_9HYPH|nr:hypothetical protein [Rhizobium paranaense]MBB5577831.1 hypothetical protein [Rhizobium paranaense]